MNKLWGNVSEIFADNLIEFASIKYKAQRALVVKFKNRKCDEQAECPVKKTYSIFKCQTAANLISLNHLSSDAKMTIWSSVKCIFFIPCVFGQTDGTCYTMPAQRVRVNNFGPVGPPFNMRDSWEWSFEKVRKML